jgi:hypothetical protein
MDAEKFEIFEQYREGRMIRRFGTRKEFYHAPAPDLVKLSQGLDCTYYTPNSPVGSWVTSITHYPHGVEVLHLHQHIVDEFIIPNIDGFLRTYYLKLSKKQRSETGYDYLDIMTKTYTRYRNGRWEFERDGFPYNANTGRFEVKQDALPIPQ